MGYGIVVLTTLGMQLPIIIVLLVGLVIAVLTWKRNPKASLLAVIGIGLMLVLDVVGAITTTLLPLRLTSSNVPVARMGIILSVIGIGLNLFRAGAWGLIVAAIFSGRKQPV